MRAGGVPSIHVVIPRDAETDALRARHMALGRIFAPVAAAIPALIYPPIILLAAHLTWRCLPTLFAQVF